ncbi:organomercurial lyase [Spirillospora sp. NPDC050679]
MPVSLDLEDLRLEVYRSLAATGRAPDPADLAERFGPGFREGLRELHERRHLVLDGDDRVLMAHPFATTPLGFAVMGARTLWWGGCAWDSFALPHLVPDEPEVLVSTRCPACETSHAWNVTREAPPEGGQVAHFLTPTARMWDDVVHTCGNQRIFCAEECVDAWLDRTGLPRGYAMDLATLWRLASRWYEGRLDHGYTRREPAEAAAYFREVGLTGPFWGL